MSNSNINAADVNAAKKLTEKYRDKQDHEKRDITAFTGVLVAFLHILSGSVCLYSFWQMPIENYIKTGLLVVMGIIVGLVEFFKSKYMENFFVFACKGTDNKKYDIDTLSDYLTLAAVEKTKTAVFWGISCLLLIVSLANTAVTTNKTDYDLSVKDAYTQSVATLKNLTDRNAKAAILKDAAAEVQRTGKAWEIEKSAAEGKNYDLIFWSIIAAIFITGLIETGIWYARKFHEKEQYKIMRSFEESKIVATKAEKPKTEAKTEDKEKPKKVEIDPDYVKRLEAKLIDLSKINQEQAAKEVVITNSEINKILNGSPK